MKKDGKVAIVPVHGNKDLPRGTLKSIEKQTGEKIL
jgi:predicted RNA binding protein YcfA (HicA-like mRNA interferase family)